MAEAPAPPLKKGKDKMGGRISDIPQGIGGAHQVETGTLSRAAHSDFEIASTTPANLSLLPSYEGKTQADDEKPVEWTEISKGAFLYDTPPSDPDRKLLGSKDVTVLGRVVEKIGDPDNEQAEKVVVRADDENGEPRDVAVWIVRNLDGSLSGVPKYPKTSSK